MLEVININTYYGDFKAIDNVSIKINEGDFITVIGPNGHGKSTLLKTICGLIYPKNGIIRLDNTKIVGLPPHKIVEMGLVYVPEGRNLFPEMTVMENLILGAYNKNARKKESKSLEFVFNLFPRLSERKKQLASTLSGGEARMLAIGRGLMSNAKILAIDEPSLGLAPNLRAEVFNKIGQINEAGITILMVEQTIVEAIHLIRRFYLMEDGKIVFEGTEKEALASEHVKQAFLGI